ncbi:hypothetical protein KKB41_00045 [Patescibacteria group bacterium]|nr:hypothetical protein [Patescibacteria group bacterium]
MPEDIFEKLNKLPKEIKEYMYSDSLADANLELIEKYKFSENQKEDFFDILNQIFVKEISPDSLDGVLMNKLKIKDDKTVHALAKDIREKILASIVDYFGMMGKREINEEENNSLVTKAIAKFNLQFSPHLTSPRVQGEESQESELKERFIDISESFLENVRTKSQFKNTLEKPVDKGGLGYDEEIAESIANYYASYLRIQEIEKKKEKEGVIPKTKRIKNLEINKAGEPALAPSAPFASPEPPLPPPLKGEGEEIAASLPLVAPPFSAKATNDTRNDREGVLKKDEVGFESEEKEAAEMNQKVEEMRSSEPTQPGGESKTDTALKEIDIKFPSADLNERLKMLIDSRLRNVRTSTQTFERLTLPAVKGGLGLTKEEADKISLILNKYLNKESHDLYKGKLGEIKDFEKKVAEQKIEKSEREDSQQKESLNKKFEKLTAGRRVKKTRKPRRRASSLRGRQENKKTEERPLSKSLPLEKGGQEGFNNKEEKLINPPQPPFSKGGGRGEPSIIPAPKPTLEDIPYKSKLYGPVEEIANMTISDFRRIAKDPKEAILKIKDKLFLLREESFAKYQAGVNAWKKSPLYKEYLNLLNQSLISGKSLEESLISSQTLNKEEFNAIIESRIGD